MSAGKGSVDIVADDKRACHRRMEALRFVWAASIALPDLRGAGSVAVETKHRRPVIQLTDKQVLLALDWHCDSHSSSGFDRLLPIDLARCWVE